LLKHIEFKEWLPNEFGGLLKSFFVNLSSIPEVGDTILRYGEDMSVLSFTWVSLINIDSSWNELDV